MARVRCVRIVRREGRAAVGEEAIIKRSAQDRRYHAWYPSYRACDASTGESYYGLLRVRTGSLARQLGQAPSALATTPLALHARPGSRPLGPWLR